MADETATMTGGQSYLDDMLNMHADNDLDDENTEITKFYEGLNVLVTGGSGFLGKLLVEKLLR